MDNLRAAILRPQLALLPERVAAWNLRHQAVEDGLQGIPGLRLIRPLPQVAPVGSSFQFGLRDWSAAEIEALVAACMERGVELKWFGSPQPAGFTSRYDHWRYAAQAENSAQQLGALRREFRTLSWPAATARR